MDYLKPTLSKEFRQSAQIRIYHHIAENSRPSNNSTRLERMVAATNIVGKLDERIIAEPTKINFAKFYLNGEFSKHLLPDKDNRHQIQSHYPEIAGYTNGEMTPMHLDLDQVWQDDSIDQVLKNYFIDACLINGMIDAQLNYENSVANYHFHDDLSTIIDTGEAIIDRLQSLIDVSIKHDRRLIRNHMHNLQRQIGDQLTNFIIDPDSNKLPFFNLFSNDSLIPSYPSAFPMLKIDVKQQFGNNLDKTNAKLPSPLSMDRYPELSKFPMYIQ